MNLVKCKTISLFLFTIIVSLIFNCYLAVAQTGQVQRLILLTIYHPSSNFSKGITNQLYQQLLTDGRVNVITEELIASTLRKYNVKTNDIIASTPQAQTAIQNLSELQVADFLLAVKVIKVGSIDYPGLIPKIRVDDGIIVGGFGERHRMSICQLEYSLYDLTNTTRVTNNTVIATATRGGGVDFNSIVEQALAFRDPPRFWDSRTGRAVSKAFNKVLAECYKFIPFYGEIIGIDLENNKVFVAGNLAKSVKVNDELYVVCTNKIPLTDGSTWNDETVIARLIVKEIRGNRILTQQVLPAAKKSENPPTKTEPNPETETPAIELGMRVYPKIDRLLEQYKSAIQKDSTIAEQEQKETEAKLKQRRVKADNEAPKF